MSLKLHSTCGESITKGTTSCSRLSDGRLRIKIANKDVLDSDIDKSDILKILLVENITIKLINEYEFDYDEDPKTRSQMMNYLLKMKFERNKAAFEAYTDEHLIVICKWYLTGVPNYLTVNLLENYLRSSEGRFTQVEKKEDSLNPKLLLK